MLYTNRILTEIGPLLLLKKKEGNTLGDREKRKTINVGLRVGALNIGTITGKGYELADIMQRRKVDVLCVKENRWRSSMDRDIMAGFILSYHGVEKMKGGVCVIMKEECAKCVVEVKRVLDRVMRVRLESEGVIMNFVSGYAPQVG